MSHDEAEVAWESVEGAESEGICGAGVAGEMPRISIIAWCSFASRWVTLLGLALCARTALSAPTSEGWLISHLRQVLQRSEAQARREVRLETGHLEPAGTRQETAEDV